MSYLVQRERVVAETQSFVFQMYELWGKKLKRLNRELKRWMNLEKENEETEVYSDLLGLKREHVSPAVKLYNRLLRQEFIRYSDVQALREKVHFAVLAYDELIYKYTRPVEGTPDPNEDGTARINVERYTNIQVKKDLKFPMIFT